MFGETAYSCSSWVDRRGYDEASIFGSSCIDEDVAFRPVLMHSFIAQLPRTKTG